MLGGAGPVQGEAERTPTGIGVEQRTGVLLPLDMELIDEMGAVIHLKKLATGKPLLLVPGYYECPRLCGLVFSAARDAIKDARSFGLRPGIDYHVVSLSFAPGETAHNARRQGEVYRASLGLASDAWPFLRGSGEETVRLFSAAGYNYRPDGKEYSHSAAMIVLTADGRVSRYLDGLNVLSRDFRFALIEAADGRIGNPIDRAFQLCFRWDNAEGRYAPVAWAFIRIGGLVTLLTLGGLVLFLRLTERKT